MKKIMSLVFGLIAVFALAACGNNVRLADKFFDTIDSGTYSMESTFSIGILGTSMEMDVDIALKDTKNIRMSMTMMGETIDMLCLNNEVYIMDPSTKTAYKTTIENYDAFEALANNKAKSKDMFSFVSSSKETKDGKNLTCEKYKLSDSAVEYINEMLDKSLQANISSSGLSSSESLQAIEAAKSIIDSIKQTEFKYYFDGENIHSIDFKVSISGDAMGAAGLTINMDMSMKFDSFSCTVDESLLAVPSYYSIENMPTDAVTDTADLSAM